MAEYRVTAVTFGLGFQSGSTRTRRIEEHVQEVAAEGWKLVFVDRNTFEIPIVWRFFWEKSASAPAGTRDGRRETRRSR